MPKFVTRIVEEIKAREIVEQLLVDGVGAIEDIERRLIGTTFETELNSLLSYIQHIANGGNAGKKLKCLKGRDGVLEYEFISKHLRIYGIQQPGRKIIIYGGIKKAADSSDNIKRFRILKEDFLNYLKNDYDEKRKTY